MTRPFRWPYSESCAGGAKPPTQPRPPEPPALPTTRRNLLGTTVAGLATGNLMGGAAITLATPESLTDGDRQLIAIGERYRVIKAEQDALEARLTMIPLGPTHVHLRRPLANRSNEITYAHNDLIDEAMTIRASSAAAVRVKLDLLRDALPYAVEGINNVSNEDHLLAWSLLQDLAAGAGGLV